MSENYQPLELEETKGNQLLLGENDRELPGF